MSQLIFTTTTHKRTHASKQRTNLVCGLDFNAKLAHAHNGAGSLALLLASLGLAFVLSDNGNTREFVAPASRRFEKRECV